VETYLLLIYVYFVENRSEYYQFHELVFYTKNIVRKKKKPGSGEREVFAKMANRIKYRYRSHLFIFPIPITRVHHSLLRTITITHQPSRTITITHHHHHALKHCLTTT
jgi:hypothetical protein